MARNRFCRWDLRTTDVDAARAFYGALLGPEIWGQEVAVARIPPQVAALGAPPHWLGRIGVGDVEGTVARLVALGVQPRGPLQRADDGSAFAIVRDPGGAIFAVGSELVVARHAPFVWHQLITDDEARSMTLYGDALGWTAISRAQLPDGRHQQTFAWDDSGRSAGGMSNTVRLPEVHPQWLHFFGVADLEGALAKVRALGGLALSPMQTSTGDLLAACDDPQGGAFGLVQSRARS